MAPQQGVTTGQDTYDPWSGEERNEGKAKKRQKFEEKEAKRGRWQVEEKQNKDSSEVGGAAPEEVQLNTLLGEEDTLREKVKTIISRNSVLDSVSLRNVGFPLHQCMLMCCKSSSMADDLHHDFQDVGSLAYAVEGDLTTGTWENAVLLGLHDLGGTAMPRPAGLRCDPAQKESVRKQLQRFDVWDEKFELLGFKKFFSTKSIDYSGEEVRMAKQLNWTAVANSLPMGVGKLKLEQFCTLGTKGYVENFEQYLVPSEMQRRLRPPKVMVEEGQWNALCEGLLERNICAVMPVSQLYHVEGKPLLNGLFAVGKGEWVSGVETQRLIMNLTPVNLICREMKGDLATLPSLANFGLMLMGAKQQCLISSEDVRCFFYLFETPSAWWRYMGFNRLLDQQFVPKAFSGQPCVLVAKVLPMGFANSVAIAQHVHRNIIKWANMECTPAIGGEGEIRKDKSFPSCPSRFRVYLDNFDQLEVLDGSLANEIKGSPSLQVLAVREMYSKLNVPRHPLKGVSRSLRAEVQGALVLGDVGVAIPKPQKLMQYLGLCMELLARGETKLKELQVVCGGLVYFTSFRRPLLCALNRVWEFMEELKAYPPVIRLPLPDPVVRELVRFLCLLPLAQICFTSPVCGTVTCSDASSSGGGMCASTGLTPYGVSACTTQVRGDVPEQQDLVQVLSIGLFDGLGALRVACDNLGLPMAGHISIEQDAKARRVVEASFPDTTFHDNVVTVDEAMVVDWSLKYSNVGVVLLGAGPPCQGVSGLNANKRGALKDCRSRLFAEVPRIKEIVARVFYWAQVHLLMESVASMDREDRSIMSAAVGLQPYRLDSLGLTLCRRPRLYWCTCELVTDDPVVSFLPASPTVEVPEIRFQATVDAKAYLQPGWTLAGDSLPTFTTARPSQTPGRKPAGLYQINEQERQRWAEDLHRFPPYQYAYLCGVLNKKHEWRIPDIQEREVCMGLPVNYTKPCMAKGMQQGKEFENCRLSLVGNSWQGAVVTWLLSQLFARLGLCEPCCAQDIVDRLTPGKGRKLQSLLLRPPLGVQRQKLTVDPQGTLVTKLLGITSIKGEDLLLQSASEQSVKFQRLRASIPAGLWKWRDLAGWAWKGNPEHINCLELRAVYTTLKWWVFKKRAKSCRFLHLVDSLVVLHALSRGRTSSRKLRRTLMRINSLVLGSDLHPVWGYVHTSINPADRPSRRVKHVKKKWVK